jgi:hypothetical protein
MLATSHRKGRCPSKDAPSGVHARRQGRTSHRPWRPLLVSEGSPVDNLTVRQRCAA